MTSSTVVVFLCVVLPAAGSSVGQSAVRSVSQHRADDWDKSPTDTDTTCSLSGTLQVAFSNKTED